MSKTAVRHFNIYRPWLESQNGPLSELDELVEVNVQRKLEELGDDFYLLSLSTVGVFNDFVLYCATFEQEEPEEDEESYSDRVFRENLKAFSDEAVRFGELFRKRYEDQYHIIDGRYVSKDAVQNLKETPSCGACGMGETHPRHYYLDRKYVQMADGVFFETHHFMLTHHDWRKANL